MPITCAVYLPKDDKTNGWVAKLKAALPEAYTVLPMSDVTDPASVDYAIVWMPPAGMLAGLPNLKAIVSIAAGIDHLLADPQLPKDVPIIRTIGNDLTQRMREFIALHVLRMHREQRRMDTAQIEGRWDPVTVPPANYRKVGLMGLGNLGKAAAQTLAMLGYQVRGWSNSMKEIEGVTCYAGAEGFDAFLDRLDTLVCLLPLTEATTGLLNAGTFAKLAPGAQLLNAARGGHMVEDDLIPALESGQLSHATLDVFAVEPLPADHPFWRHPQITVTPHIASMIDQATGVSIIAANLQAFEAGEALDGLCTPGKGY